MPIVLVKNVECGFCYKPTPLLVSSLEEKLDYRSDSSIYGIELFFACPHCKTVAQTSIPVQSERRTTEEGQQFPFDIVPFRVLLECAQTGCEARIEVLGTARPGTTHFQVQNLCGTWNFGREVQCENMHRPLKRPEIAGLAMGE